MSDRRQFGTAPVKGLRLPSPEPLPEFVHVDAYRELARQRDVAEAENRRLREALKLIAACESRVAGDVVDVARQALGSGDE